VPDVNENDPGIGDTDEGFGTMLIVDFPCENAADMAMLENRSTVRMLDRIVDDLRNWGDWRDLSISTTSS
jgi:hypothetical protein